jgi:glycosyltransferase involved in cell wall biosynthesis
VAEHPSSGAIGGAEVAMSILADRLVREGVDVHYASMKSPETQPHSIRHHRQSTWFARSVYELVNRHNILRNVRKGILASAKNKVAPLFNRIYMQGHESALSHVDADVYIQVCAGKETGYVADFCKKKGRPFIFRATSLWDADLTFHWGHTAWTQSTKGLYLQGVKQADIIAANSKNTAKEFMKHIDKEKVRFLPDGFHIPPYPDLSRTNGYVLWVGRDAPYKRAGLYADLARILPNHQFVMVGDIRSVVNPPSNLRMLGPKKQSELPEIYSGAKVVANTSEIEGFPNVLIEAAMCGVPYVGLFDPDGVVTEYSLGYYVKDLKDMARMIDVLMGTEDLRLMLGKNARHFVEEHRDIDRVVNEWLVLFEQVTHREP